MMQASDILTAIFGEGVVTENSSRPSESLRVAYEFMKSALTIPDDPSEDPRPGRLGPKPVCFDVSTHHGLVIVTPDRLSVNSQSNFSTLRANTGLYSGKWMYELQLGSKGVMQIGWGTAHCKFSQENGVGDTINSYSYDGNRVRKWNVSTHKYGEPWLSGDIIGCALDLDSAKISFYRNGRSLGTAFEGITTGAGVAYFPTVSLAFTENLTANFGSTPFRYPIPGYETLEGAPEASLRRSKLLVLWFERLIGQMSLETAPEESPPDPPSMSSRTYLSCLSRSILQELGPLLTIPYIIESVFLPLVDDLEPSKLQICLDVLWTHLESHEMKACLEGSVVYLLSAFRHVSLRLDYPDQCRSLRLLTSLCRHPRTRQYLLQNVLFDRVRFANFIHVKPLDEAGFVDIVEKTWWETTPQDLSVEVNRQSYTDACETIKSAIAEVEALQVDLLITFLDNSDGTSTTSSSRTIFLKKFRRFVQENLIASRTPLQITVCCFHRLLVAFRILWEREVGISPVFVPCRVFYDSSINYSDIDRLGGVLSYLNKTYKNELIHHLGPDHEVILSLEKATDTNTFVGGPGRVGEVSVVIPGTTRILNINTSTPGGSPIILGYPTFVGEDKPLPAGSADSAVSLLELLEDVILFYHAAAKKQIAKVANLRDSMSEYVSAMSEVKARLDALKRTKDPDVGVQTELLRTIAVFNTKLSEQARHMAWVRAAVYSREKQSQLAWLLNVVTLTLKKASLEGNMFRFVPDFYLEALADLSVGLKSHLHPTAPIENIRGYEEMLREIAQFLCDHFLDPRIVHAIAKDTLILTLAGFTSNSLTLKALEEIPRESRIKFVTNVLRPYENRAWAQSNWVLVRFWQGHGFAFRYEKSPHLARKIGPKMLQQESISQPIKPCPSVMYQMHVRDILVDNPKATTLFLNSLLNQMNWAFSEFISMVQEIHNVSSRPERVFIESRQLKICATCFDLAISLLRVIEMIANVAPSIFGDDTQSSSENLLARLCQLLCQILNRVSSQTSCFQHVVLLEIPDLESIDHFPILAAVTGILIALLRGDMAGDKDPGNIPRITRALLTEPSFQMSSLYFVLGEDESKRKIDKNVKTFSLGSYAGDVSLEEIDSVKAMLMYLESKRVLLPDNRLLSDDDDTCIICYAYPNGATFKPCNHKSCRVCIDRHLLNSRECFFCKTTITQVYDLNKTLIHDFTSSLVRSSSSSS
ncbi:E3 ubiquitin-protein ligase RNF123 [Fopius arisanus]|uniref:RING-type E3 ubiquitin transferase n=1 Tax=Fopius arisanus TaxID=64838 RepID=A0A9R1U1Q6_9HYME|nr:PREDICTED: E3 ubiquitin-protein ligase RNF123-like [Fopius arisanus]